MLGAIFLKRCLPHWIERVRCLFSNGDECGSEQGNL